MNDGVEKRAVSGPKELFDAADRRMAERMISNFSEYIRALIRDDLQNGTLRRQEGDDSKAAAQTA